MKSHRIINLVNTTTKLSYSFSLGTVTYVEEDYNNGVMVNLTDATNLYDFSKNHVGESFYINGLKGLVLSITQTTANYLYKDSNKTEPWEAFNMRLAILNSGRTREIDFLAYPYYDGTNHIFSSASYDTGNLPTNYFGLSFCWDNTKNNLTIASYGYYSTYFEGLGVYEITPNKSILDINGKRYAGGIQTETIGERIKVTPAWNGYDSNWEYIFTKYPETTNDDKDDTNKQKPIEWQYPNGPGVPSKPGGGDGDQNDTSDPVPEEDIIDGLSSDFVKLYKITKENLSNLADYMLQDNFLNNIKKLYANPMDAIISLNAMPINVSGNSMNIITSGVDTGIQAIHIANTITDIDFGTIKLEEYWGSFLDYETKISIFLPYIGIQPINVDDFMNDEINVTYRIDLLSGSFVAFIKNSKGIIHQTTGNIAYHLPITSIDYSQIYASAINGIVGIATSGGTGIIGNVANTAQHFKPQTSMKGNFSGNTGICSNKKPYLIIERPIVSVPDKFSELKGNKSNVTAVLGNCSGFTQVKDVRLSHVSCTNEEKNMLLNLLKNGVFF